MFKSIRRNYKRLVVPCQAGFHCVELCGVSNKPTEEAIARSSTAPKPKVEKKGPETDDPPTSEGYIPRQVVLDSKDNILVLDSGTNCIEVYKHVWKPIIDGAGHASRQASLKLIASLTETIDGKQFESPFVLSLGGRDHVLVGCESTFLRIPWYESGGGARNKTQVGDDNFTFRLPRTVVVVQWVEVELSEKTSPMYIAGHSKVGTG